MSKGLILERVFLGFVVGIIISVCLVFIYIKLIEPIIINFAWKKVIKNKEKLSTKEQKIIKYIQLFSFWDIDKYNYIINKDTLYKNYDYLCEHTSENIKNTFNQILNILDSMKNSDIKNNIMLTFEELYDIEDLSKLESLDEYLQNKIEYLTEFENELEEQQEISRENEIINKLKDILIKLNQSKLYSIINLYYKSGMLNLLDIDKLIEILTKDTNDLELRSYINSIILSKGGRYSVENKEKSK